MRWLRQMGAGWGETEHGWDLRSGGNAQLIWDSKQIQFKRGLERHKATRWEAFAIEAGRIDRISKGRGQLSIDPGDAWIALERLLTAIALPRARRLLSA